MWLLRRTPVHRPIVRLVCLPHAGGSAASYLGWAPHLRPDVEQIIVELPGRGTRFSEPLFEDFEALLAALHEGVSEVLDERTVLFGHSLGALLAFELARRMERANMQLHALVVSGCAAPHRPRERTDLSRMSDDALARELASLGGTPLGVLDNPELMELVLPALRADFTVAESYRYLPGEPLGFPVFAMGGSDDVVEADLVAWAELTRARFGCRMFDGGHFFLRDHEREAIAWIQDQTLG